MKKLGKIIFNTGYTLVVLAVLALALLFAGTKASPFGYEVKVVMSGSMEPVIKTGGIVVIAPQSSYNVGDIITFGPDTEKQIPVTHRVVEKTGNGRTAIFHTKGDANEERDQSETKGSQVIGKVLFTLPYIGYVIEFARTPLGFALLIGIPALLIILDELANIVWEIKIYFAKKKRDNYRVRSKTNSKTASQTSDEPPLSTRPEMKDKHTQTRFDLTVTQSQRRSI
jgi:signal peptidase